MEERLNITEMPEMNNKEVQLNVLGDSATPVYSSKRKGRGGGCLSEQNNMDRRANEVRLLVYTLGKGRSGTSASTLP